MTDFTKEIFANSLQERDGVRSGLLAHGMLEISADLQSRYLSPALEKDRTKNHADGHVCFHPPFFLSTGSGPLANSNSQEVDIRKV